VALRDPSGIQNAFGRVTLLLDANPVGIIGTAKELIEATAKTVLEQVGETYGSSEDMPALVKRAQTALGLHTSNIDRSIPRTHALAKILGGLAAIAVGVNEFRNANGSGHGRATVARGLSPRHARLTVNAARTWCEAMLETLADPNAPWRRGQESAGDASDH
jgi:hypothetical protein